MKKVTVFVGSARKKNTHAAAEQFLSNLRALGDVEGEIVTLSDYTLKTCRGCLVCFEKGEALCPLKDDRDVLMEKIAASDGVVFATPNYCFQLSGSMKTFLDRFGFAVHRPRYFGKVFTSLVTQFLGGGDDIVKYFDFVANTLGFNTVKGISLTTLNPRTEKDQQKIDRALARHSQRFYAQLAKPADAAPTLFQLVLFRIGRTTMRLRGVAGSIDYQYYVDRDWLKSDYYYPVRLDLLKSAAGHACDALSPIMLKVLA